MVKTYWKYGLINVLVLCLLTFSLRNLQAEEETYSDFFKKYSVTCNDGKLEKECQKDFYYALQKMEKPEKFPLIFRNNYFIYTDSSSFNDSRQHNEIKFRLSFQTPVLPIMKTEYLTFIVGFAYSQKSFWQITDADNSRPFRETNYNPEGFLYVHTNDKMFTLRLSPWEHESNGREEGLNTRSWDRYYIEPGFNWNNQLVASLKLWKRHKEKYCENGGLSKDCDENPDIEDYYGNFEFRVKYRTPQFSLIGKPSNLEFTLLQRKNFTTKKGAYQLGISMRIFEIRLYAEYFHGYGDSLIDYKKNVQRAGIGFMLNY